MTDSATAPLRTESVLFQAGSRASRLGTLMRDPASAIMIVSVVVTAFLVLYPAFWLFYGAFVYGEQGLGQALIQFWHLPGLGRAFQNTLTIIVGTVPLSFIIALPLVWITTRTDTPMRGVIELAALLPFITPPLIGAVAWSLLASPRTGLINVFARYLGLKGTLFNIYSMHGLIFVMSLYLSPYVFLTVKAVMERMDGSLEQASHIAGAGVWRTLRYIVLPMSMPAILSAAILVFVRSLEEFAIPGILGTPSGIYTVTTYIFYQAISYTPPRYEIAALLASLIMAVTGLGLGVQAWVLGGRQRFTTISGKGRPPNRTRLGRWRYATLGYALSYILLAVLLPFLVLLYAAFITVWGRAPILANLTFKHFVHTFSPDFAASAGFIHSVVLSLAGATITTALTLIVGYAVVNGKGWTSQALEFLTAIPLMMPGPVMAVAILWAYLNPPLVLYGTLWILLVAYITHYIPYGIRTITGSLRQLSVEFERAAAICGATRSRRFREIVFPLVRSGVLAGWLLMFVSMIRELSASIFLFVPGTETVAVSLVEMWQEANFSAVAVLALTLIVISLAVVVAVRAYLVGSLSAVER